MQVIITVYLLELKKREIDIGSEVVSYLNNVEPFRWLECRIPTDPEAESEPPKFESKSEKAAYLIKKLLSDGDMRSREIYMRMSDEGISRRTAENTKKEFGIRSYRKMRQWYWSIRPEE